ncbi:MAG: hypothetical protein EOO05_07160 [Chitinophagaceae bacterium]|nr:MAG: hypothetical protein EOO05_07160 [Chitinophagaceae bacterium]
MIKNTLFTCLFSFTVFFAGAQDQPVKLAMEQGQVFNVEVTVKNSITQQAMGQAIDFTLDGKALHNYKVTNASEDFFTLHHEAQKISFLFNGMGSKKSFDSDNKKDISGQWGEPVRKILSKKYDVVIDPAGTVMKVDPESFPAEQTDERLVIVMNMLRDLTSVSEPPAKGEASFFKVLPDKTPVVGDTWKTQTSNESGASTTNYKIESIADSTITVSFQTNGKSVLKATLMGMESSTTLNSVTTGTIIINRQTGIIREKQSEMVSTGTAEMMGNTTPVNAKTSVKMTVGN